MKTILAVLTFALVAGQSLTDEVKSFFDHIVGGAKAPAGLIVSATSNFGSNPQPGGTVSWVIDVRNASKARVYYWLVVQTTNNLSPPTQVVNCPPSDSCPSIGQPTAGGGNTSSTLITQAPPAHATITETANVLAPGSFSVIVRSGPQSVDVQDPATVGVVVATLSGQTGQPTQPTNSIAPQPQPQPQPEPAIRVTAKTLPGGSYQVGEGVTATFTFRNDGDAAQAVTLLGNDLSGLQLSDFRDCRPRCALIIPAHASLPWSVDAVIANGPDGRAPSGFSDTVRYEVQGVEGPPATASGRVGSGVLAWLAVGGAVLAAAAAATALGVNNARRKWWEKRISVEAHARADQAAVKPVRIPDHVAVRLEYGPAGPRGPIPIERIVRHG